MARVTLSPTSSAERTLAALAHAAILLPGWGLLAPTAIWAVQSRRGQYLSFQSLQAFTYQVAQLLFLMVVGLGLGVLYLGGIGVVILLSGLVSKDVASVLLPLGQIFFIGSLVVLWGLWVLGGLVAAILCLSGQDVRYPLLGAFLERYLSVEAGADPSSFPPFAPEREARWMAALTYAGVLINPYGWLIPLIVWLTQKERSALLRFQALQALLYQGIGTLVLMGLSLLMGGLAIPMILVLAFVGSFSSSLPVLVVIPWVALVLLITTLSLIYVFFGLWMGMRVAQGQDFTFPGLGPWLRRRLDVTSPVYGGSTL